MLQPLVGMLPTVGTGLCSLVHSELCATVQSEQRGNFYAAALALRPIDGSDLHIGSGRCWPVGTAWLPPHSVTAHDEQSRDRSVQGRFAPAQLWRVLRLAGCYLMGRAHEAEIIRTRGRRGLFGLVSVLGLCNNGDAR